MADGDDLSFPRLLEGGRIAAPDAVWARVRDDYLSGVTARVACRRHGVRLSAMRARAAREGWRRMDQPWAPPPDRLDARDEGALLEDRVGGDLDKIGFCDLSFVAYRRMMRAALRGHAAAALRWRRVMRVMDEEEAEMERDLSRNEALQRDRAGWAELAALDAARAAARATAPDFGDEVDSVDSLDPVF